jgi:hypothetical protein
MPNLAEHNEIFIKVFQSKHKKNYFRQTQFHSMYGFYVF